MSEAAARRQEVKRHWAEPGGRHDAVIRAIKFGLPVVIIVLLVLMALAPFEHRGDVSFILDKNKVAEARERMRVEQARYVGEDNKGQKFELIANRAVQQSSDVPVVMIEGVRGRLNMAKGPLDIAALRGRYDLEKEEVLVDGPVRLVGPDGYQLATRDVRVDLDKRMMESRGRATGAMRLGDFEAGSLSADLDERVVRLNNGVRLKIKQGAVR